jgi:hypothetical protein
MFGASASAPTASSTSAVPIPAYAGTGWPAKGSSDPGVNMRTVQATSDRSGGKTKVVSLRFGSRAIACIVAVASPATWGEDGKRIAAERAIGEHVSEDEGERVGHHGSFGAGIM